MSIASRPYLPTPFVAILVLLFALGCGSGGDDGSNPAGPGGPTTLFVDTFEGPTLSGAWNQTRAMSFIAIDPAFGQPAPSLEIRTDPNASGGSVASVITSGPFNNASGLTFNVTITVDNPGRSGGNIDGVSITLVDQGRQNAVRGSMGFHRNSTGGVTIAYNISPGATPPQIVSETIFLPAGTHVFSFIINPDRSARWMRDGVQKLATLTGVQMLTADIQLKLAVAGVGSSVSSDQAEGHFDNVTITRP